MSNTKLITLDNLTRAVRQIEAELPDTITDEQIEEILETDTVPTLVGPSGVTVSQILNMVYPVGSYYISNNNTSPAQLFGGMWERVQGKFLLGASDNGEVGTSLQSTANVAAGSTGGEATHTLSVAEMPSHKHSLAYRTGIISTGTAGTWYFDIGTAGTVREDSPSIGNTGDDQPHNNMPPFIAAYIWYRIS